MSDKTIKNIRQIYGIVLSAMLIISGILMMAACVNVYKIGDRPFTLENISAEFSKISLFLWITGIAIVIGVILGVAFPGNNKKLKSMTSKKVSLSRMLRKVNIHTAREDLVEKLDKEKKLCSILRIGAIIICIIASIPSVIYSFNMNNFGSEYDDSVISACIRILASTLVVVGISIVYVILEDKSLGRQIEYAKEMLADSHEKFSNAEVEKPRKYKKLTLIIRISIVAVALIFIVLGILNGGMADVLSKAINICTECIGLG